MANLAALSTYFIICFFFADAVVKFPKDQNMDALFPPSVSREPFSSDIPLGHLRPLGKYHIIQSIFWLIMLSLYKSLLVVSAPIAAKGCLLPFELYRGVLKLH